MDTAHKLYKMLTENTGRHFLDSGDHYGRNYESNQKLTFEQTMNHPAVQIEYSEGKITEITHDLFHWLLSQLEYSPRMTQKYRQFCRKASDAFLMDEFAESIGEPLSATFNTYNQENALSQNFQGKLFSYQYEHYLLVSIHGGCDIRGGYTIPVAFTLKNDWLRPFDEFEVSCSRENSIEWFGEKINCEGFDYLNSNQILNLDDVLCPFCGSKLLFW